MQPTRQDLISRSEVRKMLRNYSMNHTFIDTKELLSELDNLSGVNVPKVGNFYEFSDSGEVWTRGRLMRYNYRSNEGGSLLAQYIRLLPPHL